MNLEENYREFRLSSVVYLVSKKLGLLPLPLEFITLFYILFSLKSLTL